jgi:hypothetical protein
MTKITITNSTDKPPNIELSFQSSKGGLIGKELGPQELHKVVGVPYIKCVAILCPRHQVVEGCGKSRGEFQQVKQFVGKIAEPA